MNRPHTSLVKLLPPYPTPIDGQSTSENDTDFPGIHSWPYRPTEVKASILVLSTRRRAGRQSHNQQISLRARLFNRIVTIYYQRQGPTAQALTF